MRNRLDCERERKLIFRAKNNDEAAFCELLAAHMPMIYALAGRIHCASGLYEELVQAGRIGFMKALQRFDAQLNTRLITYAVPWIAGEMKREMRSRELIRCSSVPFDDYLLLEENGALGEVESLSIHLEKIDLKRVFDTLSREERKLLLLRYFRGKTQKQTAEMMNRSQAQISKTERRILETMRRQLQ